MTEAFIYDHVRSPRGRGKQGGSLNPITPMDLTTPVLQGLRDRGFQVDRPVSEALDDLHRQIAHKKRDRDGPGRPTGTANRRVGVYRQVHVPSIAEILGIAKDDVFLDQVGRVEKTADALHVFDRPAARFTELAVKHRSFFVV